MGVSGPCLEFLHNQRRMIVIYIEEHYVSEFRHVGNRLAEAFDRANHQLVIPI